MDMTAKTIAWTVPVLLFGLVALSRPGAQADSLRHLAATGSADEVRAAIQAGADFNDSTKGGFTALMAAASTNHGRTPLLYAVQSGRDPRVVLALLAAGADARLCTGLEQTPFQLAQDNKALSTNEALLRRLDEAGRAAPAQDGKEVSTHG